MSEVRLLDCTLRDGGYLNDWMFGYERIINIFERLVGAKTDFIEIGFLNESRIFDKNRTIMPDTRCAEKIFGQLNKGNSIVVGMIDFGTCEVDNIQECEESYLDGIRVIFKEQFMYDAIKFCGQLKRKGYKVFAQMVSATTYTDDKLKEFSMLVNKAELYAVGIVDTYGLMHQDNLMHIFRELDKNLDPVIMLGYHSHNNFQMAYANCIELLNTETKRDILLDGTLYGMGKSAGNAPIELLAMYMNNHIGKNYDVMQLLEAIDTCIMDLYNKMHWGYNFYYYISALAKCHPNYVFYLLEKKTLAVKSIIEILDKLENKDKLLYNQQLIEKLYLDYQNFTREDKADIMKLSERLREKKIILIGPGESSGKEYKKINQFINDNKAIVIAINFIPGNIKVDYVFLSNSKRYIHMETKMLLPENKDIKVIATSNITKVDGTFEFVLNYYNLIDENEIIPDNSFIMFLKALIRLGITDIAAAGFDGYSNSNSNYFFEEMEYDFTRQRADYLNKYTKDFLYSMKEKINVLFITQTKYLEEIN